MLLEIRKKNEKKPCIVYGGNFSFEIDNEVLTVRSLGRPCPDEYHGVISFDSSVNANIISVVVEC